MRQSRDATIELLRSALSRRPEVLEAYLFGSFARDEAQVHSDVDVAVYLDSAARSDAGWGSAAEIGADLMAALGRSDVEVVILNHATPLLYHRVLRDGERLFARDLQVTTVREGYALSRYCDWVPQLAKIRAAEAYRREHGGFGR
jgi:hypothetical protein